MLYNESKGKTPELLALHSEVITPQGQLYCFKRQTLLASVLSVYVCEAELRHVTVQK
jgi:hypothetical protein